MRDRNLLTTKTAINATFWRGRAHRVALLLFFVIYDNNNFAGQWVLFSLYVSINLMWMLVIGTAGIYSFATIAIVGACRLPRHVPGGRLDCRARLRERPVDERRPDARDRRGRRSRRRCPHRGAGDPSARGVLRPLHDRPRRGRRARSWTSRRCSARTRASSARRGSFKKTTQIATDSGRYVDYFVGLALIVFCLIVYRLVDGGRLGLLLRTARESEPFAQRARRRRRPGAVRRLHHLVGRARPDRRLLHRHLRRRLADHLRLRHAPAPARHDRRRRRSARRRARSSARRCSSTSTSRTTTPARRA